MSAEVVGAYLDDCKALVLDEIVRQLDRHQMSPYLVELMLDYPLRGGKGLRPALAIAMCRALGGTVDSVLPSAATLEMYHNAFLIHDDVEDESHSRRGRPTMHIHHGVPIAVNVGDAMLCLTLPPLIENTELLGLGAALHILDVVAAMTRRSVEGQACELRWIRDNEWSIDDADYIDMVIGKTGWYSFIAPLQIGALAARATSDQVESLVQFGAHVAVAFQITDDVLNLDAAADGYGKELAGDLWEGKRTLPLLHAVRCADDAQRRHAVEVLARPRPAPNDAVSTCIAAMVEDGTMGADTAAELRSRLAAIDAPKTAADVAFLRGLVDHHGSIEYAMEVARTHAARALDLLDSWTWLAPSPHVEVLRATCEFVHRRRT